MKVVLIDPWGINNTSEYLNGLIYGLSSRVELTVFTNCYFEKSVEAEADINRVFFKKSEKTKSGKARTVIRGIEYIQGYKKILRYLKKNPVDVVHINWMLNYKLDIRFLKKIKKLCPQIVYTAHNVIPHVNGEKSIRELEVIYGLVDRIIVHGEHLKKELIERFPETKNKVYVQKHGCVLRSPDAIKEDVVPADIKELVEKYSKVYLCFGAVFYNKGFDRAVRIWLDNMRDKDALLVIGGRKSGEYREYEELKPDMTPDNHILLLDMFISDAVLNYLLHKASVILLPYRHASMSGVVFTAAQYSKPVIVTNTGALSEYLTDKEDGFICENSENALRESILGLYELSNEELANMGANLCNNIRRACDWNAICSGLLEKVYERENR